MAERHRGRRTGRAQTTEPVSSPGAQQERSRAQRETPSQVNERIPANPQEMELATGNAFQEMDRLLNGARDEDAVFSADDAMDRWVHGRVRAAREQADASEAERGAAFESWLGLSQRLRDSFFDAGEGAAAKQLLALLALSDEELAEPRHHKAALDLLRDTVPFADAMQPLVDRATHQFARGSRGGLVDSLSSAQAITMEGEPTWRLSLIGSLRELSERVERLGMVGAEGGGVITAWQLEHEPVLQRHLSLTDPFASTPDNADYWNDVQRAGHERERFGDHSIMALSRDRSISLGVDLMLQAERLEGSTDDNDRQLSQACIVIAEWLNGKQLYYIEGDTTDIEQYHLAQDSPEEIVALLDALNALKDHDPRLFVMVLGQNPGRGGSRSMHYGNFLHKALYNTRDMTTRMRDNRDRRVAAQEAVVEDADMAELKLIRMMDQLLEMDQRVDVFRHALTEEGQRAVVQRGQEYLRGLSQEDGSAVASIAAVMSLMPLSMAAVAQRELERFREASLERPDDRLRELITDIEKPMLLLDYIAHLSNAHLADVAVRQELLQVFPRELIDNAELFRQQCAELHPDVVSPLFMRLDMVAETEDGSFEIGPYLNVLNRACLAIRGNSFITRPLNSEQRARATSLVTGATQDRLLPDHPARFLERHSSYRDSTPVSETLIIGWSRLNEIDQRSRLMGGLIDLTVHNVGEYMFRVDDLYDGLAPSKDIALGLAYRHVGANPLFDEERTSREVLHAVAPEFVKAVLALGPTKYSQLHELFRRVNMDKLPLDDAEEMLDALFSVSGEGIRMPPAETNFPFVEMPALFARISAERNDTDDEYDADAEAVRFLQDFYAAVERAEKSPYFASTTLRQAMGTPYATPAKFDRFARTFGVHALNEYPVIPSSAGDGRVNTHHLHRSHVKEMGSLFTSQETWSQIFDSPHEWAVYLNGPEHDFAQLGYLADLPPYRTRHRGPSNYERIQSSHTLAAVVRERIDLLRNGVEAFRDRYAEDDRELTRQLASLVVFGLAVPAHFSYWIENREHSFSTQDIVQRRTDFYLDGEDVIFDAIRKSVGFEAVLREIDSVPGSHSLEADRLWVDLFKGVPKDARATVLRSLTSYGDGETPETPPFLDRGLHFAMMANTPKEDRDRYVDDFIDATGGFPGAYAGGPEIPTGVANLVSVMDLAKAIRIDEEAMRRAYTGGVGCPIVLPPYIRPEEDMNLVKAVLDIQEFGELNEDTPLRPPLPTDRR